MKLKQLIGNTDNYLLDLILKDHFISTDLIIDAGCGNGRNMYWFYHQNIQIHGIDTNSESIDLCRLLYPEISHNIILGNIEKMPFKKEHFDHIISSAVLHFADSTEHFISMIKEMIRVLKVGGSLFIRTCTDKGIQDHITAIGQGRFLLGDTTERFLLTDALLEKLLLDLPIQLVGSYKSVVVNNERSMGVLLFQKLKS